MQTVIVLCLAGLFGALLYGNLVLRRKVAVIDQTRQEQARQLSQDRDDLHDKYRNMFDQSPLGIFRTSVKGRLLEANPALARMLGYETPADLFANVADLARDIYPSPDERRRLLDALQQSPHPTRLEIELQRRDGSPLYAVINASLEKDENKSPAFLHGTLEDITSLKITEQERQQLAAAVEQSGEIIIITDTNGSIEYVNQSFERITGYTRQEAIGQNPRLLKSGEHHQDFYENLWQTIIQGKTWKGRLVNQCKDGTHFTEEAVISPVFGDNGQIVNFVAAKKDITRQLSLEEQHRQLQKMETLGQLTGGVAHDFNNLLQAINGYTELSMIELAADHPVRELIEQSRQAAQRATNLVQQLLLFSRRQVMQTQLLDLNALIRDISKMLDRIIGEHIQIQWQAAPEPCFIQGDSGMLDQVLMNLCVNARDAMADGGQLTISSSRTHLDDDFCDHHAWAKPGHFALLTVADNGCGMDGETRTRIFEPFFTTKQEGQGTGLGLATSYGIIKQHGGMIDVYSEIGHGTVFKIYLPLSEADETSEQAIVPESAQGGDETILLAEDDQLVRELAETILQNAGYRVLSVENGEDAVACFQSSDEAISLVLLDVVMPKLGGRLALEQIRKIAPKIPVLFSSGYNESTLHTEFIAKNNYPLIQKPYAPQKLLMTVRQLLDGQK